MEQQKHKQTLVIRDDLTMGRGKIASQAAHAALGSALTGAVEEDGFLKIPLTPELAAWLAQGSAKIVLSCSSERQLLALHQKALEAGLPCALIQDAGRTVFNGKPTLTALGLGPASIEKMDAITEGLQKL